MNLGPTELVLVLVVFAVPVMAIAVVVLATRAGRRACPTCGAQVRPAPTCPSCGAPTTTT